MLIHKIQNITTPASTSPSHLKHHTSSSAPELIGKMPSIKEKDIVPSDTKCLYAIGGMFFVLIGGLMLLVVVITASDQFDNDVIEKLLLMLFAIGIALLIKSCQQYKGNIEVLNIRPQGCPDPNCNGTLELYQLKTSESTRRHNRIIYTRVVRTSIWEKRMHCMECEKDCALSAMVMMARRRRSPHPPQEVDGVAIPVATASTTSQTEFSSQEATQAEEFVAATLVAEADALPADRRNSTNYKPVAIRDDTEDDHHMTAERLEQGVGQNRSSVESIV